MSTSHCLNCGCEYETRIHNDHCLCPSCELLRIEEERNQQELLNARAREQRERERDYEEKKRREAAEESYRREHAAENAAEMTQAVIDVMQIGVKGFKAYLGIYGYLTKVAMGDGKELKIRHGGCYFVFQWVLRGILINMLIGAPFMLCIANVSENLKINLFVFMLILQCLLWPIISILLAIHKRNKYKIYKGLKLEGGDLEDKKRYGLLVRKLGNNGEECIRLVYDIFQKEIHALMGDVIPIKILTEHLNKSCPFILASSRTNAPICKLKEDLQAFGATVQILTPTEENIHSESHSKEPEEKTQSHNKAVFIGYCPHCNGNFEAQKEWDGMEADCPHCGKKFTIKIS